MIKSEICEILGIKHPILQGGMAWISDANLAAAVSNAGGLGTISSMNADGEWLRNEIYKIKKLTDKPFAVNIMLMNPSADELSDIVIEEKVPVIVTGAGNPHKYMKKWISSDIKVIPVVPSVGLAKLAKRNGACAVIAEGGESGGHVGDITTMSLVPQVCDAIDIPVIAAGGIADGRGVAACLMLGAKAVQLGTKFLIAKECNVHQNYKQKILKAKDIDTMTTGKRLGHPVRALRNPFVKELSKLEYNSNISDEELERRASGSLKRAAIDGDLTTGSFMAGQIAGMITKEQSCEEIIDDIFIEAEQILRGACKWLG